MVIAVETAATCIEGRNREAVGVAIGPSGQFFNFAPQTVSDEAFQLGADPLHLEFAADIGARLVEKAELTTVPAVVERPAAEGDAAMAVQENGQADDVPLRQPLVGKMLGKILVNGGGLAGEAFATKIIATVCGAERTAAPGARMFDVGVVVDVNGIAVNGEGFENIVHGGLQKQRETTPRREKSPVGMMDEEEPA